MIKFTSCAFFGDSINNINACIIVVIYVLKNLYSVTNVVEIMNLTSIGYVPYSVIAFMRDIINDIMKQKTKKMNFYSTNKINLNYFSI